MNQVLQKTCLNEVLVGSKYYAIRYFKFNTKRLIAQGSQLIAGFSGHQDLWPAAKMTYIIGKFFATMM